MAHLIDKDALVAEIKRHISIAESQLALFGNEDERNRIIWAQQKKVCEIILSFIDTLEEKEVDLEKEYKDFVEEDPVYNKLVNGIVGNAIAKHFFELGLQAAQKGE
jgi:hypothetical protein